MTQICPSLFLHNFSHYWLVCFQPDFSIGNFLMPTDFEDPLKADVFESRIRFSSCWLSIQHSLAYINIDSTLLLNRRNFKQCEFLSLLQISVSLLKVPDTCPILPLISNVTSPVFSIQLPKYLNSWTCSTVLSEHWRTGGGGGRERNFSFFP